jgi:ribokinase
MIKQIVNFGSINIDHVYQVPHFVQPGETLSSSKLEAGLGGKGANQSVAIARSGGVVKHVGQMSKSDQWALQILTDSGVDTSSIKLVEQASGHAIIQVDSQGENAILLHGGANQSCDINDLRQALNEPLSIGYLLLQNECNGLVEAIDLALEKGIKIAFNPAPMSEAIKALPLHKLDTLIVNQVEAQALSEKTEIGQTVAYFEAALPNTRVVLTLGDEGAILLRGGNTKRVASHKVDVVDTTCAGDTFVGYFLSSIVRGDDDATALRKASAAAALTVSESGAISAIPTEQDLQKLLNSK